MRTLALVVLFHIACSAQIVRIGVFSLFRPVELRVTPWSGSLLIAAGADRVVLEGRQRYAIRLAGMPARVQVTAADGSDTDFVLSIPGKIERRFHGTLTVQRSDNNLIAVVAMDRELAVASVVAAELPPTVPLEALKAQAVAARSYYAASGPRHHGFDFCDTTHCQFLREPPSGPSNALRATAETRGLLLDYLGKPFAALYSASCGGRTRSRDDAGGGYSYHAVLCDFCQRHSPGVVDGHRLGLCQRGAAGMAASGADFRSILDHYYPGASVDAPALSTFLLRSLASLGHSKN
jgi:peptidoglycan hydrolase-like amidase